MMILIFLLLISTAFSRGSSSSGISNINNVINNNNGDSSSSSTSNAAANSNSNNNNNNNNNKVNNLGGIGADTVQLSSRVVHTKYGSVSGVIVHLEGKHLDPVEAFKGIPYASPPTGSLRFMPPVTGALWSGVRKADR